MEKKGLRIGISGGTFDPIHNGHLIIAQEIKEQFALDKVIFIPSGTPPHKKKSQVIEAEHRLEMVKIAVDNNPFFEYSDIEVKRKGYTYTIDTLMSIKDIFPEGNQFYYFIGADVVRDLLLWKKIEEVFSRIEFIAALRPGYDSDSFLNQINTLKLQYGAKINIANTSLIQISSTGIREKLTKKLSIKYLVPEGVEKYIIDNGLYMDKDEYEA